MNLRQVTQRMKKIEGYSTKVVEKAGSKLKHILSNSNHWKGLPCGRGDCQPCGQPGEKKDDCRKQSIIYENVCKICNPDDERKKERVSRLRTSRRSPASMFARGPEAFRRGQLTTGGTSEGRTCYSTCSSTGNLSTRKTKSHQNSRSDSRSTAPQLC